MKSKILLCKAFLKKEFIMYKRYLFNAIGGFFTLYVYFLLMFAGYKSLAGNAIGYGDMLEGLVIGYTLWILIREVFEDVAYTILREASEGTLEQLYMSIHGFGWVMAMKLFAKIILNMIFVAVVLYSLMITTNRYLNLDIISLVIIIFFTLLSVLGIGFIFGGLALIFKQIGSYLQIVSFGFIALIAAPVGRIVYLKYLPISWGSRLLYKVMGEGKSVMDFTVNEFGLLVLTGLVYLAIGYGVYKLCERAAMDKGVLGHY